MEGSSYGGLELYREIIEETLPKNLLVSNYRESAV